MIVYSIFILFCSLQTLICDKAGVTQQSLQDAFKTSLPFIKAFHPAPFVLNGSKLLMPIFSYTNLNSNNVEFRFDEYGLLHIKFVNLKGRVGGIAFIKPISFFKFFSNYTAELSNMSWEETYVVESTKKAEGKYDIKFKSISDSSVSFNIFRVIMKNGSKEDQNNIKIEIKKLNFAPFKTHLKKASGLILETLKDKLK